MDDDLGRGHLVDPGALDRADDDPADAPRGVLQPDRHHVEARGNHALRSHKDVIYYLTITHGRDIFFYFFVCLEIYYRVVVI